MIMMGDAEVAVLVMLVQLYCCGVTNEGWSVYRSSKWFTLNGPVEELGGRISSHGSITHACFYPLPA